MQGRLVWFPLVVAILAVVLPMARSVCEGRVRFRWRDEGFGVVWGGVRMGFVVVETAKAVLSLSVM